MFYKQIKENGELGAYIKTYGDDVSTNSTDVEISEEEYYNGIAELSSLVPESTEEDLYVRIAQLETENAALLFENLTGEVFING